MIFGIKEKSIILTHTMAIAANIFVLLMTGFVLQGHIQYITILPILLYFDKINVILTVSAQFSAQHKITCSVPLDVYTVFGYLL